MSVHYFQRLQDPRELAGHPQIEPEVKRAILASWASDAFAVRSKPGLRKLREVPGSAPAGDGRDALSGMDSAR
uniref:hypothetical protein n=1 Tax=Sphingomonas sp. OTU376 TaxID=3043863 RepID=UPI00313F3C10